MTKQTTLAARNAAMEAENARLRAALENIAVWPDHDIREPANSMAHIARAALAVQPEPTPVIGEQLRAVLKKE